MCVWSAVKEVEQLSEARVRVLHLSHICKCNLKPSEGIWSIGENMFWGMSKKCDKCCVVVYEKNCFKSNYRVHYL